MNTEQKIEGNKKWIPVEIEPMDGVIKTLHTDGVEDVCMVIKGEVYSYDGKTSAAITHYRYMDNFTYTKHNTQKQNQ